MSQPKPSHEDDYQIWYNTEYGPLPLTTDFILDGYQYRSTENEAPVFLAIYEVSRLCGFDEHQYTKLRESISASESNVLDNKVALIDRRIFKIVSTTGTKNGPAPVMMVVTFVVRDGDVDEMHRWYEEVSMFTHHHPYFLTPLRSTPMTL